MARAIANRREPFCNDLLRRERPDGLLPGSVSESRRNTYYVDRLLIEGTSLGLPTWIAPSLRRRPEAPAKACGVKIIDVCLRSFLEFDLSRPAEDEAGRAGRRCRMEGEDAGRGVSVSDLWSFPHSEFLLSFPLRGRLVVLGSDPTRAAHREGRREADRF